MQGIAALNPAGPLQPYSRQDFQRMAHAVGTTYESLKPEQKKALSGLFEEISALPFQKLKVFDQLLSFLEQNATRYKDVVAELVRQGAVDEGDMPEKYNPPIFATIHSMVRDALKKATPEQGYAKGGSVSLKQSAERVKAAGRGEDKILAHITPAEAALLKSRGGSGDINPITGLPEFGWLKSIGKVLGVAAPVIGSVLGSMVGMPFLGAVVGGGLGGLASGGGVKGALMGAAMGGIGSLAFSGVSSFMAGNGFMNGVTGALPSYLGGTGESFGGTLFGAGANPAQSGTSLTPTSANANPGVAPGNSDPTSLGGTGMKAPAGGVAPTTTGASTAKVSFLDDPMKWVGQNKGTALMLGGGALLAANSMGQKKAPPSLIGSNKELTKEEREAKYPWTVVDSSKFENNYVAPTTQSPQYDWQKGIYESPKIVTAATGGIADARTGGHLEGPGTGTSDSIPAKLSDGEFVMTAKAVRGAGGGDRMKGAKKMYELMHKFERTA